MLILPIAIFVGFDYQNTSLQFSLILGLMAFPFVMRTETVPGNYRYAILAALAGIILIFLRSSSCYYFFTAFLVLFVIEKWWGRLNYLPLLLVIAVSPVIGYLVYIWSFPIRLKLSELAAKSLQLVGMNVAATGNVIMMDGNTFSVDPACIGLKLVITSLVLGIVIIGYFEKKSSVALPLWKTSLLLVLILFGAVLSNFVRLLMLIIFHILPENFMHDVVGLLSLATYVLLPFYFLVRFLFRKRLSTKNASKQLPLPNSIHIPLAAKLVLGSLLLLQIVNGPQFLEEAVENSSSIEGIILDGFQKEITSNGVLKLQSEEALIYIKPPVQFFEGSHDPRICWKGSGYTFSSVEIDSVGGKSIYTATLTKDADKIYTAWWYENDADQTPHEWNWRWQTLKGAAGYYMVNVNCTDPVVLQKWVTRKIF